MEIKGYVWGGSLHGQVTVQDSFEFVCVSRAVPAMEAVHLQADRSPAKRSDSGCSSVRRGLRSEMVDFRKPKNVHLSTAWNPGTN